jgi:DNA-binding beta-propeller fold protein YncE
MEPHRRFALRACLLVASTALVMVLAAAPAVAANRIYWDWATLAYNSYVASSGISVANLDGSGGHGFTVSGAAVDHPLGVAINSATGTMYWANFGSSINYCTGDLNGGNTISFASLNGSGGGTLNTSGATVSGPDGVAIDPAAGRLYWANDHGNSISYASLNGSGGHDLNTTGATLSCPAGLAVDPAAGRVYWTNFKGNSISYANLNGSGGGNLPITGADLNGPYGLAIDGATGKLYWANELGNSISYSNLDGSGGENLPTGSATVNGPWGVAIDPTAGRIYWANNLGASLAYANLDESGGGDLNLPGASTDHAKYPALLEVPAGTGPPVVTGDSTPGSALTCAGATWASDLPESFLFRAPARLRYSWSRDGVPIGGGPSSIIARSPGRYTCQVTASNFAGPTAQASPPFVVGGTQPSAITVTSRTVLPSGAITLGVLVPGPGTLNGRATFAQETASEGSRPAIYGAVRVGGTAGGKVILTIAPTRSASKWLAAEGIVTVTVALAFNRPGGAIGRARVNFPVHAVR